MADVDPALELRVSRLEAALDSIRADLSATRADASYIRGRLESLPSTWQMIGTMIAGNVTLVALIFVVLKYIHP
jgi:hypothetical protein